MLAFILAEARVECEYTRHRSDNWSRRSNGSSNLYPYGYARCQGPVILAQ